MVPQSHRPLHPRPAGKGRPGAVAGSGAHHLDSPRVARSDRVCRRRPPRWTPSSRTSRPTPMRRSSIGCSPRRATASAWPPLARRRPLCRHQRLPDRRRPRHVALARLGDRRVQRQHAVRPLHHRADRRRHAARRRRSSRRSPPASTAIIAAIPKGASSPRNTPSNTSSIAWTRPPPSGWA